MPPKLSGRIVKSQKGKKTTLTQKNHRWESFTTKISKLHSLDPLRRVRRHDLDAEDLSLTTSYLRNGLEKWTDLNISKGFHAFRREALPLCDSLPQILHFQDKIMELLSRYISAYDAESLEPLLDLLTAFAHDLGTQFEKFYPTALSLITGIASRKQDAAVIEWTFACLAFLFKYLSKLIVQDLRPTYDALLPLLGKSKNPPHIVRFAAEALSFMVKKAAAPAQREKALPLLIEHAKSDFQASKDERQIGLYYHGLMTMFAEAIKGQGHGAHTTGPEIVKALITSVPIEESISSETMAWSDLVCGILVSIVHHTTEDTFGPILEAVITTASSDKARAESPIRNCLYIRILGTITGVRRGNRVSDWPSLVDCVIDCLRPIAQDRGIFEKCDFSTIWSQVMANIAIATTAAPMDAVIPSISELISTLTKEPLMKWFIPFCSYFSDLDSVRFRSLFLKPFQKFVVMHWSEDFNEDMLCIAIPRMVESRSLPSVSDAEDFSLPQSWQDQIVSKFERLEASPFPESGSASNKDAQTWYQKCLPKYSAFFRLLEITTVRPSTHGPISDLLLRKLKLALRPSQSVDNDEARFIVSEGFSAYLRMCKPATQVDMSLGPLLRAAAPRYHRLTGFLEAMIAYEDMVKDKRSPQSQSSNSSSGPEEDPLLKSLIEDLSSPSHEHRKASLNLLSRLEIAPDQLESLATMLQTENTPLDIQNIRGIGVHIRKLAASYSQLSEDSWLRQAIPSFLFGMMTVQLTPIWDTAVEAMKQIGETKQGAEVISQIAFGWMAIPSKRYSGPSKDSLAPRNLGLTDFECLNLSKLQTRADEIKDLVANASEKMFETFQSQRRLVPATPLNARSQALKVFSATPDLAEKRSRNLVPFFLKWSLDEDEAEDSDEEQNTVTIDSWSLFDKKALVGVFAQFVNPKVLFQTEQVYTALLGLLANGDIEMQKSALKAILAWKQEGVKPYQENLEYLLDEARFKNEITVLFQGDRQIQPEHRHEMMPVLLRLLYGRTISKKGVSSGRGGQHATRLAVLRQLSTEDMGGFLDIALGELRGVEVVENGAVWEPVFEDEVLPIRKQAGFLRMMEAMITELGENDLPYTSKILNAVMYCLIFACRKLAQLGEDGEEGSEVGQISLHRVVRSSALKCLISLLQKAPSFEWTAYQDAIIKEVVSPRLDKFSTENTEGVSGTLQLLSTIAQIPKTAIFMSVDERIIPSLAQSVTNPKTKDLVKIFVLGIIRGLVAQTQKPAAESEFNELILQELLHDTNIDIILSSIATVLKSDSEPGKDLLAACVESVVELSPMLQESPRIADLIDIAILLLVQASRKVNPKIKGTILSLLENLLQLDGLKLNEELKDKLYTTNASLFGYFKDGPNRQRLSRVFAILCRDNPVSVEVAELCSQLNSFRERRVEEPDYKMRLAAFNIISQSRDVPFTPRDWEPLVYNMIFFLRHDEEYGVLSSNSADGLSRLIDVTRQSQGDTRSAFDGMLSSIVMPAIHANSREESETVRRETVRVLGALVTKLPEWPPVSDLVGLNGEPDENDSDPGFFNNILSPATSKQMRALQLLSKVNHRSQLNSRNVAHFLIPFLEHFIFGRQDGADDHGIGAQAGTTISDLAVSLEWPQYRATLRRYIGYIQTKPELQKQLVRLLGKTVDSLAAVGSAKSQDADEMDVDNEDNKLGTCRLSSTMPAEDKFNEDMLVTILPPLIDYLHEKDETTVSSRVPIGIILVKILKLLPQESLDQKLPGVLTDICHILRSKSLDSRDMARDTLAKMSVLLGPSCFGFVLKELRGALTKGYQLHILSFTMHTILVHVIPHFQPGDLDYCLEDIMAVIMDDIFGITGQEKDAEEYTNKMKEIKSSKSHDSMELISKSASVAHLSDLVRPLQSLLLEKLDIRMVRKIDDLLTRISVGLMSNAAAESRDTLIFCYEIIQRAYKSDKPQGDKFIDPKVRRYLVQKGARKSGERGSTSKYTFKLVRFAIDVLRSVLRKHDSLRNAGNISGFIPILGDAIVDGEEEVKIATFKLLSVLVKVPFKNDHSTKIYQVAAKDAIKCISTSISTATDLAQTALKLLSVILRDRRDVPIRDAAVDMLLTKVKDDLTEPLYRHVSFNFLRSVLERKVETATVYDTLDHVGTVMITNDDQNTRDLARGAYFQFLREYPQKKNRWAKQLNFIVANLKYEREGGRLSALETVHLLLMKSAIDFVQEIASSCFIPLVFVLANDDSEKCRLAAGELIKVIFQKADKERTSQFLTLVRNWSQIYDNPSVARLGIQAFSLYFEARDPVAKDKKDVLVLIECLTQVLEQYASDEEESDLINTVLQTVPILIAKHPATTLADSELWGLVSTPLTHPDDTVKLSGVRVLTAYLADFYENNQSKDTASLPGSHGLELDAAMVERLVLDAVAALNPAVVARWKRRAQKKAGGEISLAKTYGSRDERTPLEETLATEVSRVIVMLSKFLEVDSTESESDSLDKEEDDATKDNDNESEDDEDEWGGIEEGDSKTTVIPTPTSTATPKVTLNTVFSCLSDILIEETPPRASSLIPKLAAIQILTILCNTLPPQSLLPSLQTLLTPLHHLTDPHITAPSTSSDQLFHDRHESLRSSARELSGDVLQRRIDPIKPGTYTSALLAVTERSRRRREARGRKRKIEAVAQPEKWGKWKKGRLDRKVKRRKERAGINRERRHQY